jgi:hypothetical protein
MMITVTTTDFESATDYSYIGVYMKYREVNDIYHIRLEDIAYIRERDEEPESLFVIGFCGKELRITEDEAGRIIRLMQEEGGL